jgi:hypothetical protein
MSQGQHVSLPKGNVRVQLPSLFYHSRREIQAEDGCASVPQVAGDVIGATAHIAHFATARDLSSETVE